MFSKVKNKILTIFSIRQRNKRLKYCQKLKKSLKNTSFSLISNNCNGAFLLHELGVRFNSQFVNLFMPAKDYISYLKNMDYYNNLPVLLNEEESNKAGYPVGNIEELQIHFVHYKTFYEAVEKWNERKLRLNKKDIFIIFTEQTDTDYQLLKEFDNLPYQNKVVFTKNNYKDIKSQIFVKHYKNNPLGVHMFFEYKNRFSIKRNYDIFDFVSWFNGEKDIKKLNKQ